MSGSLIAKFILLRGFPYLYNTALIYFVFFLYENHNEQQFFNNLASITIIFSIAAEGLVNEFPLLRNYIYIALTKLLCILVILTIYIFSIIYLNLVTSAVVLLFLCTSNAIFFRFNLISKNKIIYVSAFSRILILLFIICAVNLKFNFSLICFLAITLPLFINTILLLFLINHKEYALEDKNKINNYKILISYFVFNVLNGLVFPNFSPTDTNLLQSRVNSFIMNNFYSFYKVNKVLITNLSLLVGIALNTLLITFFHELDIYFILSIISLIVFISILSRNTKII